MSFHMIEWEKWIFRFAVKINQQQEMTNAAAIIIFSRKSSLIFELQSQIGFNFMVIATLNHHQWHGNGKKLTNHMFNLWFDVANENEL